MPKDRRDKSEILTTFTMRMPKDMLMFLKQTALDQEKPVSALIMKCLEKFRKRIEAKNREE